MISRISLARRLSPTLPMAAALATAVLAAVGCATSEDAAAPNSGQAPGGNSAGGSSNGPAGDGDGDGNEQELEDSFLAPAVSGNRIFSVNPGSGRVAIIDTQSLDIQLANAGFSPSHVVALPQEAGVDRALVLNSGSNDATLLAITDADEISTQRIETHAGANSVSVSEDGAWAVVWTDYRKLAAVDPTDGFQDITVIDLSAARATRLTVGFRPVVIAISTERDVVYVSSEPGIDVVSLDQGTPTFTHSIAFAGTSAGVASEDVSFTADTRYAFIRHREQAELAVLELEAEQWSSVPMSGIVTDLDLSRDGSTVAAVIRSPAPLVAPPDAGYDDPPDSGTTVAADAGGDAGDAAPAPTPMDAEAPEPDDEVPAVGSEVVVFRLGSGGTLQSPQVVHVPGEFFGSVSLSATGGVMALYTTAVASDRITLLHTDDESRRTVTVKSPVLAVLIADDSQHAVALQAPADQEGATKKGAFSLISLEAQRSPKIVATDAPPVSLALVPGATTSAGLVTVSDPDTRTFASYLLGFPALTADPIRLASEPLATGVVADSLGFVAQRHPEGRLTLVDLQSGVPRTLTGFELAAKVVE